MKYVALFRGINVGTSIQINMKMLKLLFERIGYSNVSTYINSGNVMFESTKERNAIRQEVEEYLLNEYKQTIKVLIKTKDEIVEIAKSIPLDWKNDINQKTDVAYLFDEIDYEEIVNKLPIIKDFIQIIYISGALIWNVKRENYNQSHLNKIISNELYKDMTVRNVNTARYLGSIE